MIFANFDLKVITFAYFGLKVAFKETISLNFLSRVIISANFTLKGDWKVIISLDFSVLK